LPPAARWPEEQATILGWSGEAAADNVRSIRVRRQAACQRVWQRADCRGGRGGVGGIGSTRRQQESGACVGRLL